MHVGIEQTQKELDFSKYKLNELIALFSYGDKNMILLNKNRALSTIDCLQKSLTDTKEFINSLID